MRNLLICIRYGMFFKLFIYFMHRMITYFSFMREAKVIYFFVPNYALNWIYDLLDTV